MINDISSKKLTSNPNKGLHEQVETMIKDEPNQKNYFEDKATQITNTESSLSLESISKRFLNFEVRITGLETEVKELQKENKELQKENKEVKAEVKELQKENKELQKENKELKTEVQGHKVEIKQLKLMVKFHDFMIKPIFIRELTQYTFTSIYDKFKFIVSYNQSIKYNEDILLFLEKYYKHNYYSKYFNKYSDDFLYFLDSTQSDLNYLKNNVKRYHQRVHLEHSNYGSELSMNTVFEGLFIDISNADREYLNTLRNVINIFGIKTFFVDNSYVKYFNK